MSKYLFTLNYSADGSKGLLKEGGSSRETMARKTIKSMGGSIECIYYALGAHDCYFICDLPDEKGAALGAMLLRSNGFTCSSVQLLTPAEIDEAVKATVDYTPPQG